jgi:hypothetical protein
MEFRKISRVGSRAGATNWYLSDDCLLAAKRVMHAVEYRRFYLRDLESIIVWPSRLWMLRPIIPGVFFIALGASLWHWVNLRAGAVACEAGVAWAALELLLGPTAKARIRTGGIDVDLPLVKRTRRAGKVLAQIDAALIAAREGASVQPTATTGVFSSGMESSQAGQTNSGSAPAAGSLGDLT